MQTLGKSAIARSGAICVVLVGVAVRLGGALGAHPGATDRSAFDATLVRGATGALLVVTGWAALIAGSAFLHALGSARAGRALDRCCPRSLRRLALLSCGLAVVSAAAIPSYAADGSRPGPGPRDARTSPLAGLPRLDRPRGAMPAGSRPPMAPHTSRSTRAAPTTGPTGEMLRVRPGDSLWRIVARRHPRDGDAELTRRVRALYLGNRAVIGPNADLILPGQRLRPTDRIATGLSDRATDAPRRNRR